MKDPAPKVSPLLVAATALLVAGIFIIDLFTPKGITIPLLYTVPLLVTLLSPQLRLFLIVAMAAIVLTLLGYYFSPAGGMAWMSLTNRLLAVLAIGTAAVFSLLYRRVQMRLKTLEEMLPMCSACKRVRDDKGYWKQLELYLEEHAGAQFSRGLCPECLPKHLGAISS